MKNRCSVFLFGCEFVSISDLLRKVFFCGFVQSRRYVKMFVFEYVMYVSLSFIHLTQHFVQEVAVMGLCTCNRRYDFPGIGEKGNRVSNFAF